MKSFREYLEESKKTYQYRIKTIVPIEDGMMDRIEEVLSKYDALEVSRPKVTILQKNPMDFPDIEAAEVYIIDTITNLAASSYELQQLLRAALNIPEKFIVVRGTHEPIERYTTNAEKMAEIEAEAAAQGLTPAPLLSTDSVEPENQTSVPGDKLYGDKYNMSLLRFLNNNREGDKPETGEDFNKDHAGVKPVPFWEKGEDDAPLDGFLGKYDNLTDDIKGVEKVFTDKKGQAKVISKRPKV